MPSSSLSLWDSLPYETTQPEKAETKLKQQPLWLAVCLPKLALEVLEQENDSGTSIVVEQNKGKMLVHTVSQAAEKLDIKVGMSLNAAYALYSALQVFEINKTAQQQKLQELANWALKFSAKVSLHPPCSFLLEVQGSIKYFGSLAAIQNKLAQELKEKWQHTFYQATTPTPAASLMLAESGRNLVVKRSADLRSSLGDLSINTLPLDKKQKKHYRH